MPPTERPRPRKAVIDRLGRGSKPTGTGLSCIRMRAESCHRLNRAEYRNAVRDLLALDIDINDMLPNR